MPKWIHRLTNKDFVNKTATCSECGLINLKIHGKIRQVQCRNAYNASRRGISLNLLPKPERCPICLLQKKLVLDHKHGETIMRGWICDKCNRLIGWLKEDTQFLKRMVLYIDKSGVIQR